MGLIQCSNQNVVTLCIILYIEGKYVPMVQKCSVVCDNDLVMEISQYFHRDSSRQLIDVLLEVLCFYVDKFSLSSCMCTAIIKYKI
jgi:hypothetical protein